MSSAPAPTLGTIGTFFYGCTPTYPPENAEVRFLTRAVFVSVCRYSAAGRVVSSGDLDLVDSTSARVAIQGATREVDSTCPRPKDAPFVVVVVGGDRAVVDLDKGCFSLDRMGYQLSDELRRLVEKS